MKKVVLASLLACAAILSGLASASAQTPVSLGTQPAAAAPCPPMPDAEFAIYNNAKTAATPQAQAAGYETYLTQYPQSCYKLDMLVTLMALYAGFDPGPKILDAAGRVLALDPNNLRALVFEAYLNKTGADAIADPAAKQAALDAAAGFAQKGLAATKPPAMSDADFKTLQGAGTPIFYSAIGTAALNKKDTATAIDAFKKELASVPVADTQNPAKQLPDTYLLGLAYLQSTPPDLLDCTFYMSRFVAFAPEPYKSQIAPTAKYCYKQYHGKEDGYDTVIAAGQASLNPAPDFSSKITPAPTPADIVKDVLATTPDLSVLAVDDKEFILQNGTPDQATKVWDTVKGKSSQFPDVVIIESTPGVLKVAISQNAVQTKTADFTFNMAPPEDIPEPKATATPAQKAAYKKAVAEAKKKADEVAALTTVGSKVTLTGTYDSFTPSPIMVIMKDGDVVLPKPAAKPKAATPVHHAPAHK